MLQTGSPKPNNWQNAVIYQVYPRSFQDSNGDGVGDLPGIISRLPYIASLGVTDVWISPFFKSPQKDYGYDVSDYYTVDPLFGTNADFKKLIEEAHALGLRVMIDLPLCHSSDQHPWFKESASSRTNPKADWYIWHDGKPDGSAPNNWLSVFPSEGSGWRWHSERQQYYCFNFLASQPALNWRNPELFSELLAIIKHYLDFGVDGFRLDAINFGMMNPTLADNPTRPADEVHLVAGIGQNHPMVRQFFHHINRDDIMQKLAAFRQVMNNYPNAYAMGEVGLSENPAQLAADYCSDTHLHTAYTFGLLNSETNAVKLCGSITNTLQAFAGKHPAWSIGNHDVKRVASRFSRGQVSDAATVRNLVMLSVLPGLLCLYQGDELGLPQANLSYDDIVDPYDKSMYPNHEGRDGARTPMPWIKAAPNAGFSTAKPWLPVDKAHYGLAVDQQESQAGSMLNITRRLLAMRLSRPILTQGACQVAALSDDVLVITRSYQNETFSYAFNFALKPATVTWKGSALTLPAQGYYSHDTALTSCMGSSVHGQQRTPYQPDTSTKFCG